MTRSPALKPSTPAPTSTTSPAPSLVGTNPLRWGKISAAQYRDVAEVQGDGVDADQHLAPLQPRIVFLLQAKIIQAREVYPRRQSQLCG